MLIGITLALASIIGLIYGIIDKNKFLAVLSVIVLIMVIAVWMYFYNNPY